jgi:hypothetical protein
VAAVIAAVVPRSARAAAFESRTTATVIGTAGAAAVASTAAVRPLEPRTRTAADARGIARKILTRSARTACARRTSFAGEKNHVVFDDGCFSEGLASGCGDHFLFAVFDYDTFVLDLFRLPKCRGVFGGFLSRVGSEIGAAGGAARLDFRSFFFGKLGDRSGGDFFRFLYLFFCLFLLELGATDHRIGFRSFLSFFVFCFDDTGSQRSDLLLVQFGITAHGCALANVAFCRGDFLFSDCGITRRRCFAFGASLGQEPAGKTAGEAAGNTASARTGRRWGYGCAL